MTHFKRIANELRKYLQDQDEDVEPYPVKVFANNDDLSSLLGEITGPPHTPYVGGKFQVQINVPETYPVVPPRIKFLSKIWHPNITSYACLDVFQDKWLPTMTLKSCLLSIQQLLTKPAADSPLSVQCAKQYLRSRFTFERTAKYFTHVYANGPYNVVSYEKKVEEVMTLIDDENRARRLLASYDWNVRRCLHKIRTAQHPRKTLKDVA